MTNSIKHFTGFDISGKTEAELYEAAKSMGIEVDATMGKGKLIDEIFGAKCEGHYIQLEIASASAAPSAMQDALRVPAAGRPVRGSRTCPYFTPSNSKNWNVAAEVPRPWSFRYTTSRAGRFDSGWRIDTGQPRESFGGAPTPAGGDPWTVFTGMDWSSFSRFFDGGGSFDDLLGRIEWAITKRAVEAHRGNKTHAARTLKRSYRWLRKLEKEHMDLNPPTATDA